MEKSAPFKITDSENERNLFANISQPSEIQNQWMNHVRRSFDPIPNAEEQENANKEGQNKTKSENNKITNRLSPSTKTSIVCTIFAGSEKFLFYFT